MGVYWCAIDEESKLKIEPPLDFISEYIEIFHPKSPFAGMVMMENLKGFNFKVINDSNWQIPYYNEKYKDITDQVYEEYLSYFT